MVQHIYRRGSHVHGCVCVGVFMRWSCKRFIFIDLYKLTVWYGMVWYGMRCVYIQLIIHVPAPNAELTICWFNLIYAHSYWMCWDWKYAKQIELMQNHTQCLTTKITNVPVREREKHSHTAYEETSSRKVIGWGMQIQRYRWKAGIAKQMENICHITLYLQCSPEFSFE